MTELNPLEKAVLSYFLAGEHPTLQALREQLQNLHVSERIYTGVGFVSELAVSAGPPTSPPDFELHDVEAEVSGLSHGAGFVLFIRKGHLKQLEGFSYDEPWPKETSSFALRYANAQRRQLPMLES